jgi:putative MATE family efflux protein
MTLIMFFDFLIGLADVFVAGRISTSIQAAYGIAFQVYFIFFTIAMAFTVGTVSVVSRLFTANREEEFCASVYSSLVSAAAGGLCFGAACFLLGPAVIGALRIPAEVKEYAIPMIRVYSTALAFDYILLNTNGILRSSKQIMVSLRTMSVVAVLNVILNFVLAFGTPLGYLGIAAASALSIVCGVALNSFPLRRLLSGARTFSRCIVLEMMGIGWPMALQSFLWQASSMAIYTILGRLPYDPVGTMAAFTNGLRIESAIFLPVFAFNMANAVVVGNLIGRGRREDAWHNGIVTAWLGVAIVFVLTALVILFAPFIMPLVSPSPDVIRAGITYLRIAFLIEPVFAWGIILAGGLSGAGDTRRIMLITVLSLWVVRIPLAYFLGLSRGFGPPGIWWAMNASICVQTFFLWRRYMGRKWLAARV